MAHDAFALPDRRSVRLPGFDYAADGAYFVTICADRRRCIFGDMVRGRVVPTRVGGIIVDEWNRTATLRPEISQDGFVLMPNHVHGIVWIGGRIFPRWDAARAGPIGARPRSLSSFISGFKAAVTSRAMRTGWDPSTPVWQRGYYEHVVRSERALWLIQRHIAMNPAIWRLYRENPHRQIPV